MGGYYEGKTKEELAKLGIHGLGRTPGKLINPKGPINGYLSAFGIVWGKLKMTGEQAQKAMGFTPKKGAIGVVLARRKYIGKDGKVRSGIFASSLMPSTGDRTKNYACLRIKVLSKFASKYLGELIHRVWNPLVKNKSRKPYDGYFYFMSENAKNIGVSLKWDKLVVSKGELEPIRKAPSNWYDSERKQLHFIFPRTIKDQPFDVYQTGIAIVDLFSADSFHISPLNLTKLLFKNMSLREPIYLEWTPREVKGYKYEKFVALRFQKRYSRFFGYVYWGAPKVLPFPVNSWAGEKIFRSIKSGCYTPYYPDFKIPEPIYSPSLSFRIRTSKSRGDGVQDFHLIINILE